MADKKQLLLFGILFFILFQVFAQDYFIDRSGDEPQIVQRLSWENTDFASRYTVIVEYEQDDGEYIESDRVDVEVPEEAEVIYADLSLPAGNYRYRIEVFDLLDKFAFVTDWYYLEITRAFLPKLFTFSPQAFYLDEDYLWVISITGENLFYESEVYLLQNGNRIFSNEIFPSVYIPDENGQSARLEFAPNSLVPGEYSLYAVNPGGLDALLGDFIIAYRKPVDFNVSLGYSPIVPLYGHLFKNNKGNNDYLAPFPGGIYLLSGGIRASVLPFKRLWGYIGAELTFSYSFLKNNTEHYSTQTSFLNLHLSLLYQRYFFKRNLAFNIHVGGGLTGLAGLQYKYTSGVNSESVTSFYPSITFGASLMIYFYRPYYIQTGIDYIQMITPQNDKPMSGFIRPYVNFGIRF